MHLKRTANFSLHGQDAVKVGALSHEDQRDPSRRRVRLDGGIDERPRSQWIGLQFIIEGEIEEQQTVETWVMLGIS